MKKLIVLTLGILLLLTACDTDEPKEDEGPYVFNTTTTAGWQNVPPGLTQFPHIIGYNMPNGMIVWGNLDTKEGMVFTHEPIDCEAFKNDPAIQAEIAYTPLTEINCYEWNHYA